MTVIHAYRRKESTLVELFGLSIEFKPNDKKDVVAEVDHEDAVQRLLSIREAYRLYAHQPAVSVESVQSAAAGQNLAAQAQMNVAMPAAIVADAQKAADDAAKQGAATDAVATGSAPHSSDGGEAGKSDQDSAVGEKKDGGESQSQYVFTNEEGESIDISKWTAAQIREFGEANAIELPKGNSVKVGELRDLLAAALRADSKE